MHTTDTLHEMRRLLESGTGAQKKLSDLVKLPDRISANTASTDADSQTSKTYQLGVYTGQFADGKRHGCGQMKYNEVAYPYPFPSLYQGQWKNDKIQGTGEMLYNDQSKYDGCWTNGIREGPGIMTFANGNHYTGTWAQDKMQKGLYTNMNQMWSFQGTFINECPDSGTLTTDENKKISTIKAIAWHQTSIHAGKPVTADKPVPVDQPSPAPQRKPPTKTEEQTLTASDIIKRCKEVVSRVQTAVTRAVNHIEDTVDNYDRHSP